MRTDYKSGLLQVSAALHEYYGLESSYEEDEIVQQWLQENKFRCVIVLLVDAMGSRIMAKHLGEQSFLRSHMVKEVMSVFPPTTTAATTALLTGKSPVETGWLGWNQYVLEIDDHLILFLGKSYYTDKVFPGYAEEHLPIQWLPDALLAAGIPAETVWPVFGKVNACDSFGSECRLTADLAQSGGSRFIYTYWDGFDDLMHLNGTMSDVVNRTIKQIDASIEDLAHHLPEDTGLLVIADHGMTDITCYDLRDDLELCQYFRKAPSLEPRACMFHLHSGTTSSFIKLFQKKFNDAFEILTKEEILQQQIFGTGPIEKHVPDMLGDVIAIAKTPLSLFYGKKGMKGHHAGGLVDELMIPVVLYPKPSKTVYNGSHE